MEQFFVRQQQSLARSSYHSPNEGERKLTQFEIKRLHFF
jgi:hypothetical protein